MPAAKECPSSMFPATASTSCLYLHSIIRPPEMASASVAFFRRFVYNPVFNSRVDNESL